VPDSIVYTCWAVDTKRVVKREDFDHHSRSDSTLVLRSHYSKVVRVGSHGGEDQSLFYDRVALTVS